VTLMNPSLREMRDELSVGEEFVNRYNKPGPRYTSYPTAPVWTDSFGPKEYEQALAAAEEKRSLVSLYMHLPFCECLCLFCACNVIIQKDKRVAPPYLGVLKKETDHISHSVSRERQVVQFHWGGGTPTYLSPEQIEDLFTYTRERFTFAPDAEIGIGGSACDHARAPGDGAQDGLQPAQHGDSRLQARGAESGASDTAV